MKTLKGSSNVWIISTVVIAAIGFVGVGKFTNYVISKNKSKEIAEARIDQKAYEESLIEAGSIMEKNQKGGVPDTSQEDRFLVTKVALTEAVVRGNEIFITTIDKYPASNLRIDLPDPKMRKFSQVTIIVDSSLDGTRITAEGQYQKFERSGSSWAEAAVEKATIYVRTPEQKRQWKETLAARVRPRDVVPALKESSN